MKKQAWRLGLFLPGAALILLGALGADTGVSWPLIYLGATLLLLGLIPLAPGEKKASREKKPAPERSGRHWIARLCLVGALLASLAGSAYFGLKRPFMMQSDRIQRQDTDYIFEEVVGWWETMEYQPDWPYAGELRLALHSLDDGVAFVTWGDHTETLAVSPETRWYVVPVHGYAAGYTITCDEAANMISVDNRLIVSDYSIPRFLAYWMASWGLCFCLYMIWRRRMGWAAFSLTLGLSLCLVGSKTVTIPHGWDEIIHRGLTWFFAGQESESFGAYVRSFSLWNIGYVPAAVGTALGSLLGMPLVLVFRLSNFCSSLAYSAVCGVAVSKAPKYKLSFLALAAMPVCVFQAGSYTYDGTVIAAALLGIALLLRWSSEGSRLTAGKGLGLMGLLCVCMLPKPVYALLLLLLLWLPVGMFRSKKEQSLFRTFAVIMLLWSFVALLMPGQYDNVVSGDVRLTGTDSAGQLAWMAANPVQTAKNFVKYFVLQLPKDYL